MNGNERAETPLAIILKPPDRVRLAHDYIHVKIAIHIRDADFADFDHVRGQ